MSLLKRIALVPAALTLAAAGEEKPMELSRFAEESRADDEEKLRRFHRFLESRELLDGSKPKEADGEPKDAVAPGESADREQNGSEIVFHERLSTGRILLAWEGEDDRFYEIQGTSDDVRWGGAFMLPVMNGVGIWGEFHHALERSYRIVASEPSVTLPSAPSGGDGVKTFGATLAPAVDENGEPSAYTVHANVPPGVRVTGVDLRIDGEIHSHCEPVDDDRDSFVGSVRRGHLSAGPHTVHAVVNAHSETTAVLEQPGPKGGVFRSPVSIFHLGPDAPGFRISEWKIAPADPQLPAVTEIAFEILPDPEGITRLTILNEDDGPVREWTWEAGSYPLRVRKRWDGTESSGTRVPAGRYRVELVSGGADIAPPLHIAVGW